MQSFSRRIFTSSPLWLLFVCVPVIGQHGSVTFKHFKTYPSGQWEQQIQAYRGGVPAGPPENSVTCSSPLSVGQAAAATTLGNDAAPMCSMKVLKDEESTAEYEQVCNLGPQEQVIHSTMRAMDDRTISTEIRNSISGHEMSFAKITSRYAGTCTVEQAAPSMLTLPAMRDLPKPSAEQCAAVPEMKKEAAENEKNCKTEDMPEADRVNCVAAMQRLAQSVRLMEAQCK